MQKEKLNLKQLLAKKQAQINSFVEITKAVNNNFSRAALYKLLEFSLEGNVGVKNIALFTNDGGWSLKINKGNTEIADKINIEEFFQFHVLQDITRYKGNEFSGFDYLIPIVHKKEPLAYLLIGDIPLHELDSIDEILKFIETIVSFIITSIENKRLFKSEIEKERMNKEVRLASQVQNMLIPSELPKDDHFQIAAAYNPHGSIGGDYYDVIPLNNDTLVFCMCDVSGKGLAAGMIMANFQANLRSMISKHDQLEELVPLLNTKLYEVTQGDKFITMFLGFYDIPSRKLRYVNAGHNPIYLHQKDQVIALTQGCTLIGAFETLPKIEEGEQDIDINSLLFCYTDGLTEQENEDNEMYGEHRVEEFIHKNHQEDVNVFIEQLQTSIEEYKGEKPYEDDLSLLAIRFL